MRSVIYMALLCFVLLGACKDEQLYTDELGGFSVKFSSDPVVSVDTFQTELGQVELYAFLVELSTTHAQMLTYSDYPIGNQYIKNPYEFIDGAKFGALKSLGITDLELDEHIEFMGVPGVEVVGNNGGELSIHYKLFLKGSRLYQLGVLTDGGDAETAAGEEFIESFVFINND